MEVVFPDIAMYQGWSAPLRIESDVKDLEVISGAVPKGLNGTWYRCGPDWQYPSMRDDQPFIEGEGMVHMLRFEDGHVDYRSRWVRTDRWKLQDKARRSLFGRYRNRYTDDPEAQGVHGGTGNTNAIFHGGKLLALKEDDLPYELDPDTLETRGKYDYEGTVRALRMSAHPKLDLITGELLTFSYQAKGDGTTDIAFYIIDADGRVDHEVWFNMPYAGMVHDFAVTETHVVFPFFPMITDMEHVRSGGTFYQWHPDKETMVAILPRRGTAEDIRWFRGPATSAGHMMNAVTEGSKVHLDLCLYEGNCFPFFQTPKGETTPAVPPILTRMTFDLTSNSGDFTKTPLCPIPGEMPRTDDRYQGRPYRHGYMIMYRAGDGTSGVGHLDFQTGKVDSWAPGAASAVQEPQFVPRTPDSPEGDGWLLVLVNRLDQNRTDIAVLDAQNLAGGPVALLRLPIRIRSTFHGMWTPAETLKTGRYAMQLAAA